jgi:group I intron endonuclease
MSRVYIYKISFPSNPKVYIGKTIEPEKRWWQHQNDAKNGSRLAIHRAMRKYGIEFAIFEIISTCLSEDFADEVEISFIKQYNSFGANGYNMTPGGEGCLSGSNHPMWGKRITEETRRKRSISLSGKRNPNFGKFGEDSPNSKIWQIWFVDTSSEIVKDLQLWAKRNNYNSSGISSVYHQRQKRHKDIIKVEKL